MKNKDIADLLTRMGMLLEIKGENLFKIKAYFKAADHISALPEDIADIRQQNRLEEIPGVGKVIKEKIVEWLDTGRLSSYEKLTKEIPESLLEIINIPSVGPKKAKLFYEKLNIKSPSELLKAAQDGQLEKLPGIQNKTIEKIIKGIGIVEKGQERINRGAADHIASGIVSELSGLKSVKQIDVAGSFRRCQETVRDIDILVQSSNPGEVMEKFVNLPVVKSINARGDTKSSVMTDRNIQIDLRVVDKKHYGAALLYFTGSKNFNIKLRQIAIKKKLKVNEYGVFKILEGKEDEYLAGKTETDCLRALGLNFVPPELREEIGIHELFDGDSITSVPELVDQEHMKGEFHVHSTYSDGKDTIEQMAEKAKQLGYEYLAISDHSIGLRIARGVSPKDLVKKRQEIDRLNQLDRKFHILMGSEVEIDTDGNLDYNDSILSEFDVVIAAIHGGFEQSSKQLTKRLISACTNKYVNIIAHPMGVHFGKRDPYQIDFKEVCKAAVDNNIFLEINSFPIRLDLDSHNVYLARKYGVKFVINSDAHRVEHMDYIKYGIGIARRGWLNKQDILNSLTFKQLNSALKKNY